VRLHHITSDDVVFLYDHTLGERPRVGDSYYVREFEAPEALVVQIVALGTFDFPSLGEVLMRQIMEDSYGAGHVQTFAAASSAPQVEYLGLAQGKIRRRQLSDGSWGIWNGWLPSRNVSVDRIPDEDVLHRCGLLRPNHPLTLGSTLDGRDFAIGGQSFEKVNVITALKGMGISHLAKVLLLQLTERSMVSVVFDVNQAYNRLPALELDDHGLVTRPGTIILSASRNFRVRIEDFGRRAFIRLFDNFNPTETTRNMFEQRVNSMFDQIEQLDLSNRQAATQQQRRRRPFVNINHVRAQFPDPPRTNEAIWRAIMDRLEQIEALNLFAVDAGEGASFHETYARCAQRGGTIVVDLAPLHSQFARETFVGAALDMVEHAAATSPHLPFVFFEEAHLYASGERIANLVTRARHLGVTSTFVTNMVTQLDETVLRQVDNLFLLYLPHKDDVCHVAKSATTDEETVSAFAQRIEMHHAMVVGRATANYPIVFRVSTPDGVDMAGETRYAFRD
jgi:hypothetical protein